MKKGFIKSKGTHNIGSGQDDYTFGTKNIQQASSYAGSFAPRIKKPQPGSTGFIVGFNRDDKWKEGTIETEKALTIPRGEMATMEKIPVSDVNEVYSYVPTELRKGEYWAHNGWGDDFERSVDHMPDTIGGWKSEDLPAEDLYADPDGDGKINAWDNEPDVADSDWDGAGDEDDLIEDDGEEGKE